MAKETPKADKQTATKSKETPEVKLTEGGTETLNGNNRIDIAPKKTKK